MIEKFHENVMRELKEGEERTSLIMSATAGPNVQNSEVEAFLAGFEEFPYFVSAVRKILPKLEPFSGDIKLKLLKGKTRALLYKTAYYLHHTKKDLKQAERHYWKILERFPGTPEATLSNEELARIRKTASGRGAPQKKAAKEQKENEREPVLWSDDSDETVIEPTKDPVIDWTFRSPGVNKGEPIPSGASEEELGLFIGRRSKKYLRHFKKFRVGRRGKFSITWHWPALLFGCCWMFYRKLYGWGLLELLLSLIPGLWFVSRPIFAMTANYLVFKRAMRRIDSLKELGCRDLSTLKNAIEREGGTDSWVPYMAIPLIIVQILIVGVTSSFLLHMWPFLWGHIR